MSTAAILENDHELDVKLFVMYIFDMSKLSYGAGGINGVNCFEEGAILPDKSNP